MDECKPLVEGTTPLASPVVVAAAAAGYVVTVLLLKRAMGGGKLASLVGPGRCCSPRRPTHRAL